MTWYALAVGAFVLLGLQRFLYKVSAAKGCNTAWTTLAFMGTVAFLSFAFVLIQGRTVDNLPFLLFIGCVNSISFLTSTLATMEALKRISAAVTYTLVRLNIALVVVFSVVYFKDRLSGYQVAGIVLALVVVVLMVRGEHPLQERYVRADVQGGLLLVAVAVLAGFVSTLSSKFAAMGTDIMAFMVVSYGLGTILSWGLRRRFETAVGSANHGQAVLIGLLMGVTNFVGFYAFLAALATGPLSIVVSITGMYFVMAVVLSAVVYKERLGFSRVVAIVLALMAVLLLRM